MTNTILKLFVFSLLLPCLFLPEMSLAGIFPQINLAAKQPYPPRPISEKCTDFSGRWKGNCTITGPLGRAIGSDTMEIIQTGCTRISDGKKTVDIGYVATEVHPQYNDSVSLDWNPSQTQLRGVFTSLLPIAEPVGSANGRGQYQIEGHSIQSSKSTMNIENYKLLFSSEGGGIKKDCIYEKQL